ncbi:MAG: FAD:protein FMN transferase [Clostridiales bacterium]|nr:FAD:protein FMN transferase [Clostridiales bacterium]
MKIFHNKINTIAIVVTIFLLFTVLASCTPQPEKHVVQNQFILGTFGHIQVRAPSEYEGERVIQLAFERIRDIENLMSISIKESDISRINTRTDYSPTDIDNETLFVVQKGIRYEEMTYGAFNIALGTLINLWDVNKQNDKIPNKTCIISALKYINTDTIRLHNSAISIECPHLLINLGGIAKGYAVDEAVKILKKNNVTSSLVSLGGDIYALGYRGDGLPWVVGIQNPKIGLNNVIIKLPLSNKAIVTSGDYERYFLKDGVRYHHILDPTTGHPVDNQLTSVTIISDNAIDGDVFSTAVFVMGLEKGIEFIESQSNVEAILITKDNIVHITSGLENKIEIIDSAFSYPPKVTS